MKDKDYLDVLRARGFLKKAKTGGEYLTNAGIHRNYAMHDEHIKIFIFDDRMEIRSPGKLAGLVTLENMKDVRYARNSKMKFCLVSSLKYIRIIKNKYKIKSGGASHSCLLKVLILKAFCFNWRQKSR